MSAEHTPGQLEYGECSDSEWWIAQVGSTEQIAYTVPIGPGVAEANARRLVASWNACEGIETHALELMTGDLSIRNQITATGKAKPKLTKKAVEYRSQRDELLAALKEMLEVWEHGGVDPYPIKQARAAIANVEGGAA